MKSSSLYYVECYQENQLDLMVLKVLSNLNYSTASNKARGSAEVATMQTDTGINTQISQFFSRWKGKNKDILFFHLTGYWYPALHEVTWSFPAGWNRQCKSSSAVHLCIDSCADTEENQEVSSVCPVLCWQHHKDNTNHCVFLEIHVAYRHFDIIISVENVL